MVQAACLGENNTQILPLALGGEDFQTFSPPIVLPAVENSSPGHNLIPLLPLLLLDRTHPIPSWWTQARFNPCQGHHLLQEGFGLSPSPGLHGEELGRR